MTSRPRGGLDASARILLLTALLYLLAATAGLPGRPVSPETAAAAQEEATPIQDLFEVSRYPANGSLFPADP